MHKKHNTQWCCKGDAFGDAYGFQSHYFHKYVSLTLLFMMRNQHKLFAVSLQECGVFNPQIWPTLYPKIHTVVSISFLFLVPIVLCIIFYLSLSCVVCAKKRMERRGDDDTPLRNGGRSSRSGTLTKTSTNTKVLNNSIDNCYSWSYVFDANSQQKL